jgi:thiamine-monophosphate kinase
VPSRSRAPSEHEWIGRLIARLGRLPSMVRVGPGDDCAALRIGGRTLLVTTDALVDGVHFRRGWLSPRALGERAYRVNASDVAAMGGRPIAAVVAMEVPRNVSAATLDGVVAGFVAAARRHGAALVGGNLARGPALAITVTLLGLAPGRVVTRAGARPGDVVVVTGAFGATGTAVRDRRRGGRTPLPRLPDRVAVGVALARIASAMIDVSDGLVQDLGHVARASGVAIRLEAASVPVAASCRRRLGAKATAVALAAGEDYELALTVPARRIGTLDRLARRLGCRVTRVGAVEHGRPGVAVVDATGAPLRLTTGGFDHLAGRVAASGRRR